MKSDGEAHSRRRQQEKGSALLVALLLILLATAIGSAYLADVLVDVRIFSNERSYQEALSRAVLLTSFCIQDLIRASTLHPNWQWQDFLQGPDDSWSGCPAEDPNDWDPLPLEIAAGSPLGSSCNRCGDDGILWDPVTRQVRIGRSGILFRRRPSGEIQALIPDFPDLCPAPPAEDSGRTVAHGWIRLSDNPEPDRDPAHDTDGRIILRTVVATANLPSDARSASPTRHAVARMEAWLKRSEQGSITVLAVREVVP